MTKYNYFEDVGCLNDPVFESIAAPHADDPRVSSIFEEGPSEESRIEDLGGMQTRSQAMAVVLTWVDEKDFSIGALDAIAQGIADVDGDGELDEAETEELDSMFDAIAEAIVSLGGDQSAVDTFIADGDDDSGKRLGEFLSSKLDEMDADDDLLVSRFAVGESLIAEAAARRVVRNGQIRWIKKRTTKIRLSAAQRAALKKARRKAHTGAARIARKKAMKVRQQKGL